jgi:hypothetical protein
LKQWELLHRIKGSVPQYSNASLHQGTDPIAISSKTELIGTLEKGWNTLFKALNNLSEKDLLKNVYIRGESHSVIEAIERQLAHYAYHIGQIVYIGKQIKSEDWESLSIPKGKSESYLQQMLKKHQPK